MKAKHLQFYMSLAKRFAFIGPLDGFDFFSFFFQ